MLTLLGIGAMNSPRYAPAGLLVSWGEHRIALDGGGTADPGSGVDAWLVCDARAELGSTIRRRAKELGVTPRIDEYHASGVRLSPLPVRHTSHDTYGYLIRTARSRVAWLPEFWELPDWAEGCDLVFADAAGWERPIRFAGGVGGHASVRDVARRAPELGIKRVVFAHVGRPSIRAIDRGETPSFGEIGEEGARYEIR